MTGRHASARLCAVATVMALMAASAVAPAGAAMRGSAAAPVPAGPVLVVPAVVVRVIDGDTIAVTARPWPRMSLSVAVRLDKVDTPEIKGRCDAEKTAARAAKAFLAALTPPGTKIHLVAPRDGRYGGRVIAGVILGDGRDLNTVLLASGHARPYGTGRRAWCE